MLRSHIANAQQEPLFNYLRMKRFIHASTDGPLNPYAKVYDRKTVERDFPLFEIVGWHKHYMHAPPLPRARLAGRRPSGVASLGRVETPLTGLQE